MEHGFRRNRPIIGTGYVVEHASSQSGIHFTREFMWNEHSVESLYSLIATRNTSEHSVVDIMYDLFPEDREALELHILNQVRRAVLEAARPIEFYF